VPSPNRPEPLLPQHRTAPDPDTAHENAPPTDTPETSDSRASTGTELLDIHPSPNWPERLEPQHQAVPVADTAQE